MVSLIFFENSVASSVSLIKSSTAFEPCFIPTTTKELTDEEEIEFQKMLDKMEDDDDVMAVYHNIG